MLSIPLSYFPYIFLGLSVVFVWLFNSARISACVFIIAIITAILLKVVGFVGLGVLALFTVLVFSYKRAEGKLYIQNILVVIIFVFSLGFFSHLIPGFNNLLVFNKIYISKDAFPFTMYLNFDKVSMGLIILMLVTPVLRNIKQLIQAFFTTLKFILVPIVVIMLLSLVMGFVRFDFKFGDYFWLWLLNNIVFVSMAEEILFRGFLQNHLYKLNIRYKSYIAVLLPAIIFGALHYSVGINYIILATISGVIYGFIFHKTKSVEMSILAHSLVNVIHIIFFTYPALQGSI